MPPYNKKTHLEKHATLVQQISEQLRKDELTIDQHPGLREKLLQIASQSGDYSQHLDAAKLAMSEFKAEFQKARAAQQTKKPPQTPAYQFKHEPPARGYQERQKERRERNPALPANSEVERIIRALRGLNSEQRREAVRTIHSLAVAGAHNYRPSSYPGWVLPYLREWGVIEEGGVLNWQRAESIMKYWHNSPYWSAHLAG